MKEFKIMKAKTAISSLSTVNPPPSPANILGIQRGITSVIGSGGKTSLLSLLSLELSRRGSVILTTSTHILPFSHCNNVIFDNISEESKMRTNAEAEGEILALWDKKKNPILCLGTIAEQGKLSPPPISFSTMQNMADYVLVEADGSKRLPGKAHGTQEPQIPKESQRCILVFGASALHQPISKVIHRAEIFQNFFTPPLAPETILTKEILASALQRENLGDLLFINQLDCLNKKEAAELLLYLQQKLHKPVYGGSLREGFIIASEEAVPS